LIIKKKLQGWKQNPNGSTSEVFGGAIFDPKALCGIESLFGPDDPSGSGKTSLKVE
jgi:hypothetical protein